MADRALHDQFSTLIDAPDFIKPFLHFFATDEEMRLVVLVGRTGRPAPAGINGALLDQAYRKYLLDREDRDGAPCYRAGSFYNRLKNFAQFGNYLVVPKQLRRELDAWDLAEYMRRNDNFSAVMTSGPDYDACHNAWVLLEAEVEQMIDAATAIRLLPCDCKMLADNCGHSREICLVLDAKLLSDRTGGRDLDREEAKKLIRGLEKEGLMHTGGPPNWRQEGPSLVCNCCGCCCYPFRASRLLGAKGKWPRSRYVAVHDPETCTSCGACLKRCHFGAFSLTQGTGAGPKRAILFSPDLCWGCGICASGCPSHSIRMADIAPQ